MKNIFSKLHKIYKKSQIHVFFVFFLLVIRYTKHNNIIYKTAISLAFVARKKHERERQSKQTGFLIPSDSKRDFLNLTRLASTLNQEISEQQT